MPAFQPVTDADFVNGEHQMLAKWSAQNTFQRLRQKNAGGPRWSFLDGPITANNPMGVHHAWGRTYKDVYQRFFAMTGHDQRYQNGFDCQGLWVEVEVEKQLGLGTKTAIHEYGIDRFVIECKKRVLRFAARQTEQSVRLGYWMDWDDPEQLRLLAEKLGTDEQVPFTAPSGKQETGVAHQLVERLGNHEWGGSYFTFSTDNNETIWTFLKKCFTRGKIYQGHDVMPWSGRGGSAYSQMEIAEGRRLTTHKSVFVRFPIIRDPADVGAEADVRAKASGGREPADVATASGEDQRAHARRSPESLESPEYLLIWTTTPWTLTSNVAAAVNPELDYVKIKAKRDDAIYYFAKENLNYQRLSTEFKDGFGRPEWKWPKEVGKLKTIAQIFKEQGGFEELETIKGADMVGWAYEGPFDDLEAQQLPGGFPVDEDNLESSGARWHKVVDGGRDSRGSAHVVAGEGTGIVHMAPGCGDIDHKIGQSLGMPVIAPLREDGTYAEPFGEFAGKEAIAPETAELVFEKLKARGLLVAVETYPHIYPHCWRTGDELVFRLVDEWFINMDWRDEIKDVTRAIRWLPESIDGQNREVEWLTNMGNWMISKKRFWGLALPIWVDEETGDFEVLGSLAELKERAVEGWDGFEGNTPHRPWIDGVKIRNEKTGNVMSRIEDVGNPWLDAGIVPFSTMGYNENHSEWEKWYPADLVTECFPGQFRNWFYSMLSLSTMMRYDEADTPEKKRPFKTLLGHRLVMDENGQPMHKSDGTAIWFEEAAEQLGVDTLRWMYLAHNPAVDLRFGLRHPDQPVTLNTPEGEISETKEGLPTCKVTSTPADEIRRRVLIPVWNCYKFFVDYAIADDFAPSRSQIAVADRPEIDRWVLSRLQSLIRTARDRMSDYDAPAFCAAAASFIDDLSNWYIRRNRRRFWRAKDQSDADKLAAYQTLHEVLLTLSKLLAPCIPFLTERIFINLSDDGEIGSVHLCDYPSPDESLLDEALNTRMAAAQTVVRLGHQLREENKLRVRLPLAELRFAASDSALAAAITQLDDVIREELNVKKLTAATSLDDIVGYAYKPNLKTLGPKYGKLLGKLRTALPDLGDDVLSPLRRGENLTIDIDGESVELEPNDVLIDTKKAEGWASASDAGLQVALSTETTPELEREGMARDFIRHVQQLRKDAGLDIQDRIMIAVETGPGGHPIIESLLSEWGDYIKGETLANDMTQSDGSSSEGNSLTLGDWSGQVWIVTV